MKTIIYTTSFKKDLKRYRDFPEKIEKLGVFIKILRSGERIPERYQPHKLKGDQKKRWECHIENNLLLLWEDPKTNEIFLARFGTHAEVLGL